MLSDLDQKIKEIDCKIDQLNVKIIQVEQKLQENLSENRQYYMFLHQGLNILIVERREIEALVSKGKNN